MNEDVQKEIEKAIYSNIIAGDIASMQSTRSIVVEFQRTYADFKPFGCTLIVFKGLSDKPQFRVEYSGRAGSYADPSLVKEHARLLLDVCVLAEGLKGRFG